MPAAARYDAKTLEYVVAAPDRKTFPSAVDTRHRFRLADAVRLLRRPRGTAAAAGPGYGVLGAIDPVTAYDLRRHLADHAVPLGAALVPDISSKVAEDVVIRRQTGSWRQTRPCAGSGAIWAMGAAWRALLRPPAGGDRLIHHIRPFSGPRLVEISDVVFAVNSIPAICRRPEPFIVLTSTSSSDSRPVAPSDIDLSRRDRVLAAQYRTRPSLLVFIGARNCHSRPDVATIPKVGAVAGAVAAIIAAAVVSTTAANTVRAGAARRAPSSAAGSRALDQFTHPLRLLRLG